MTVKSDVYFDVAMVFVKICMYLYFKNVLKAGFMGPGQVIYNLLTTLKVLPTLLGG